MQKEYDIQFYKTINKLLCNLSFAGQYRNKSAISGAQLVPIGIPTICWYTIHQIAHIKP